MAVVEFPTGAGGRVYVQVRDDESVPHDQPGLSRAGTSDRIVRAVAGNWEQALGAIRDAAEGALDQLCRVEPPPQEVKIAFGVAVHGTLGATLVSAAKDAHLTIEVVWKNPPANAAPRQ